MMLEEFQNTVSPWFFPVFYFQVPSMDRFVKISVLVYILPASGIAFRGSKTGLGLLNKNHP